jgi:hypothetical protein
LFLDGGGIAVDHPRLSGYRLEAAATADGSRPRALFCDNETNIPTAVRSRANYRLPKDGINDHVITGANTVNPMSMAPRRVGGTRSRFPPGVRRRFASDFTDLINRYRP